MKDPLDKDEGPPSNPETQPTICTASEVPARPTIVSTQTSTASESQVNPSDLVAEEAPSIPQTSTAIVSQSQAISLPVPAQNPGSSPKLVVVSEHGERPRELYLGTGVHLPTDSVGIISDEHQASQRRPHVPPQSLAISTKPSAAKVEHFASIGTNPRSKTSLSLSLPVVRSFTSSPPMHPPMHPPPVSPRSFASPPRGPTNFLRPMFSHRSPGGHQYFPGQIATPPMMPSHSMGSQGMPTYPDTSLRPCMPPSPLMHSSVSSSLAWTPSGPHPHPIGHMRFAPPLSPSDLYTSSSFNPRMRSPHQQLRISRWVNPIPPDPDDGQQQTGEQELATKLLQIQSKRFYIDVKQNRRGRFMKVAEIGADGRRNQIFLALSTAAEFRDHLSVFSEFYANLGPPNPDTLPEDGKLKSETMIKDNRRYYLDLKENSRGRFLRVSQTIARGGPRCQIAIPAQGLIEFRDALQELLEEFGTDDGGYKGELPEGRHMRVENKNFYFDIGQNNRGIYMRISEVKTNFRTAITIPEKSWSRFRDIFADYVDKMKDCADKNTREDVVPTEPCVDDDDSTQNNYVNYANISR